MNFTQHFQLRITPAQRLKILKQSERKKVSEATIIRNLIEKHL